jgi:hypothetical protein
LNLSRDEEFGQSSTLYNKVIEDDSDMPSSRHQRRKSIRRHGKLRSSRENSNIFVEDVLSNSGDESKANDKMESAILRKDVENHLNMKPIVISDSSENEPEEFAEDYIQKHIDVDLVSEPDS